MKFQEMIDQLADRFEQRDEAERARIIARVEQTYREVVERLKKKFDDA